MPVSYGSVADVSTTVIVVVTIIVPVAGPAPPVPPEFEPDDPEVLEPEPLDVPEEAPVQVVVTEDDLGSLSQVWDVLFVLMLGMLAARGQAK